VGSQECEHKGRFYDGRVSVLRDRRHRVRGRALVLRDITDRKEAELALKEARRELEHRVRARTAELAAEKQHLAQLNAAAVEIARCKTTTEVLRVGIRLAREATGCDATALWFRSPGGKLRLAGSEGLSKNERRQLRRLLTVSNAAEEAMSSGATVLVDGLSDVAGERTPAPQLTSGTRAAMVPLVSRRQKLGVLCLWSRDADLGASEETLSLALGIASQISTALENTRRYEEARFLADRDSSTGLLNHRGISKRLDQEVARAERSDSVLAVVVMDVDNFKLLNDTYGHAVGDRILQWIALVLTKSLRRSDVVARYGGDEFIAILPGLDAGAAVGLAERLRVSLNDHSLQAEIGENVPITMSYGVAIYPTDGRGVSELLAAADGNLYRSKRKGGDFITAPGGADDHQLETMGAFTVLDGLVNTVDGKDHYTRKHSDDVTEYALALASELGLSLDTQRSLRIAGLLHDVGKVGVPDNLLRKPARLSQEEYEAIKQHVMLGELIIKGIPNLREVVSAVASHHECFDGTGYPRGLMGTEIPLLGRILAVTDAYSAMTTDRPYRKALSPEEAQAELKRVSGTQLDPKVVGAFLELLQADEQRVGTSLAVAVPL